MQIGTDEVQRVKHECVDQCVHISYQVKQYDIRY